jgi:hypothetical protein
MAGPQMNTYSWVSWRVLFVGLLFGAGTVLLAQCPAGAVCVDTDDNFVRLNGNTVQGHTGMSLSGDHQYYFYPALYSWEDKDGSTFGSSSGYTWGSLGGTANYTFSSVTLSSSGPGTYTATGYHVVYCPTSICGSEVYFPPYSDGWNGYDAGSLAAQRPTISTGSGIAGVWWLNGLRDPADGYDDRTTLNVNTNCASCTETPAWSVTVNSSKISLSCNNCSSPTVTSQQASGGLGDISIKVSLGGFDSDTFAFTVNTPSYLSSEYPYASDVANSNGYWSYIYYAVRDLFDYPFPSIPISETFGTFVNDQTNNWPKPMAGGSSGFTGYVWVDNMAIAGTGITPPVSNPQSPLGTSAVDHAAQDWYVGSATPGSGVHVHTNTHQHYTDHGRHL